MRRSIKIAAFLVFFVPALSSGADEQRTIKNENIGNVTLSAPKEWKPIERHHINFGTTFYRLVPPQNEFDFEILFNDLKHMQMETLVDKDLERYMESNMARAAPQSTEGKVTAKRFGIKNDGVYARLTDNAPKPGEWMFFTQGVRLLGNDVVFFTLYSNDKDGATLEKALEIISSVKIEK